MDFLALNDFVMLEKLTTCENLSIYLTNEKK